jgi:hypothetical protein
MKDTFNWVTNFMAKPNNYSLFKNPLMLLPSIMFHRFQPKIKKTDVKNRILNVATRIVWCLPQRIVALEYLLFGNILEAVLNNNRNIINPVYSSGLNNFQISSRCVARLRGYMSNSSNDNRKLFTVDYSKFDSTVHTYFWDTTFAIFYSNLKMDNSQNKCFDCIRFYSKYCPYVDNNNKFLIQERGVSSGSLLTNLIDTIVNLSLIIISEWLVSINYEFCKNLIDRVEDFRRPSEFEVGYEESEIPLNDNKIVCGDDCMVYANGIVIEVLKSICFWIGMKIEVKECIESPKENTYFLGRYWDNENKPFQTEFYMTSHIILRSKWYNKEEVKFDISEKLQLYRILSICCQFKNGLQYLEKTFGNWKPYVEFKRNDKGFYYLKEWPLEEYEYLASSTIGNWRLFG